MKRLPVLDEDRRSVGEWFTAWGELVARVDFKRARPMFADDIVGFGSVAEVMTSLQALERDQWRNVWPTIEDYRNDIATLEVVTSPDRLMAMGALIFRSTGRHPDGTAFRRDGRATATLMRTAVGAPWIGTHTHFSLVPGTPGRSHGARPEAL
jgi:ketosteroid isomerase-like protein